MNHPARARLAAAVAAFGIMAASLVAVSPAVADDDRDISATIPVDTSAVFEANEVTTHEGGARADISNDIVFGPAAAGTLGGVFTIEGDPAIGNVDPSFAQAFVFFLKQDSAGSFSYTNEFVHEFDSTGRWSLSGLAEGTYRVEFVSYQNVPQNRGFWGGAGAVDFWFESVDLVLGTGVGRDFGSVNIGPREIGSTRLAGADRFATSVEISKAAYRTVPPGGVPVVYVVNGFGFADALSAGPAAAASDGVMLLVDQNSISAGVVAELRRLNPQRIVAVGGTGVVSEAVVTTLGAFSGDVDRLGGSDRYATSRLLVDDAFGVIDEVFVATGNNFPDALAAGPAASRVGGAVLLVDGSAGTVSLPTSQLITKLGFPTVSLAGGLGAISGGVETAFRGLVGQSNVFRYGGTDRYETASLINWSVFGEYGSDYALIASGLGFADALAAGPLAAIVDSPLYLAQPTCIPESAFLDILDLFSNEVWVIGGTGVLSNHVLDLRTC
jgi:putative cell wall-binding protein